MATIPVNTSTPLTSSPLPAAGEKLEQRFHCLAEEWARATGYLSSMTRAAEHPAYQEIISLGPDVVPLLLRDMEKHLTHWFIALEKITGAKPIPKEAAGKIPEMVQAWLNWAKANGYQW
jgi:hypothetical protein